MKKINFKILLSISFVLIGFFSLFFITDTKVFAQTEDEVVVETLGYSQLDQSNFIFNGAYYNNFYRLGFTTYFEYKEGNNPDLSSGADKTISIVRDSNVEEANDFYSSPNVTPYKTYNFRAVGYYNDDPSTKFYGKTLNFNTGILPTGSIFPYFLDYNNVLFNNPGCFNRGTNYPNCTIDIGDNCLNGATDPSTCIIHPTKCSNGAVNYPKCTVDTTGKCKNGKPNPPVCIADKCANGATNYPKCTTKDGSCINGATKPPECVVSEKDSGGGLVKCGTKNYEDGIISNECTFNDILTLINDVIHFVLYKMIVPIAAIMFAYAGFELLTSGGETSKRQKAKKIFTDVAIGLIVAVAAFLIVKAILAIVGYNGQTFLE